MTVISSTKKEGKVFFGWWIVFACSVLTGLGFGFYTYGFGVIFKQISTELGINRAMTSLAAGIGRLESGLEAPLTGWLVDKFGPKWVIFTGVSFISAGLILLSFVHSIWLFYFAWGFLVAIGTNLGITIPLDKTITTWFVKKRGLAMGIKMACLSLSSVVLIPLVTWLVASHGWRAATLLWGILMGLCLFLVVKFIRQKGPEHYGLLPDGAKAVSVIDSELSKSAGAVHAQGYRDEEFTAREAMKTGAFWLLIFSSMGQSLAAGAISIHTIPFLTDMGITATTAGLMMSLLVLFSAPARFLSGVMADRVKTRMLPVLLGGFYFLQCLGISIFLLRPSLATIYVFLILFGFGTGAPSTLMILIRGRFFGRNSYGFVTGIGAVISAPIGLLAPIYAGWIYDTTGSYTFAFMSFAATTAIATILVLCIRPPKKNRELNPGYG